MGLIHTAIQITQSFIFFKCRNVYFHVYHAVWVSAANMEERSSSQSPPDETHSLQQVRTRLLWLHCLLVISGATLERWITVICLFCQPLAGELRHFIPSAAPSLSCRAPSLEIWGCLSAAENIISVPKFWGRLWHAEFFKWEPEGNGEA